MFAPIFFLPQAQPLSDVGTVQPGCYLRFYLSETTTLAPIYADNNETPLANPLISDDAGRFVPIRLDPRVAYRIQLFDVDDVLLFDVDPVFPAPGNFVGQICLYDGEIADIPAGWVLMNGSSGTIDTRDRYPIGASSTIDVGELGGSDTAGGTTGGGGAHDHGAATGGHALTEDENGPHHHRLYVKTASDTDNNCAGFGNANARGCAAADDGAAGPYGYLEDNIVSTQLIEDSGDGDPHAHDITPEGNHTHSFSGLVIQPPFFGIHFIKFVG